MIFDSSRDKNGYKIDSTNDVPESRLLFLFKFKPAIYFLSMILVIALLVF